MATDVPSGLAGPATVTPRRRPRSVRRTSHIDIAPAAGGGLVLAGAARDLRTDGHGMRVGLAEGSVRATLDAGHRLVWLDATPADDRLSALVGLPVAAGFRAALGEVRRDRRDGSTPVASCSTSYRSRR